MADNSGSSGQNTDCLFEVIILLISKVIFGFDNVLI